MLSTLLIDCRSGYSHRACMTALIFSPPQLDRYALSSFHVPSTRGRFPNHPCVAHASSRQLGRLEGFQDALTAHTQPFRGLADG